MLLRATNDYRHCLMPLVFVKLACNIIAEQLRGKTNNTTPRYVQKCTCNFVYILFKWMKSSLKLQLSYKYWPHNCFLKVHWAYSSRSCKWLRDVIVEWRFCLGRRKTWSCQNLTSAACIAQWPPSGHSRSPFSVKLYVKKNTGSANATLSITVERCPSEFHR